VPHLVIRIPRYILSFWGQFRYPYIEVSLYSSDEGCGQWRRGSRVDASSRNSGGEARLAGGGRAKTAGRRLPCGPEATHPLSGKSSPKFTNLRLRLRLANFVLLSTPNFMPSPSSRLGVHQLTPAGGSPSPSPLTSSSLSFDVEAAVEF
jgi:hypothetical protein